MMLKLIPAGNMMKLVPGSGTTPERRFIVTGHGRRSQVFSIITRDAGEKKVFEAGNLIAEPADGSNLLQICAGLVIRCSSEADNTPPGFPGQG